MKVTSSTTCNPRICVARGAILCAGSPWRSSKPSTLARKLEDPWALVLRAV
ncbi:Uncharacterised protein [Mycobacteroides abscessus subsp. abscessus]|nr:Uncharacterised protein [Mycobacteroides abscessus subsp. abscessus]